MRIRRLIFVFLLPSVLVATVAVALRQNMLPADWHLLPALDLAEPNAWLVDWRLARLKSDATLCGRTLRAPWVEGTSVSDEPLKDGCGWSNGVRLTAAGGARLHVDRATCELAAALAMWLTHVVQPAAEATLGSKVVSVQHLGGYSCRNVKGSPQWAGVRSEHARANALDITGFTLAGGRQVSVARHWVNDSAEARFLRTVHARACDYFRVAIGPDYNEAHRGHFHYDRGLFTACR